MKPPALLSTQPIFIAAKEGNLDFLKDNIALINSVEKNNETLFHYAAARNQFEVLEWLIRNHCVHINQKNSAGATPLHYAAFLGHFEVVELLFLYHPPSHYIEKNQVLFYAVSSGNLVLLQWFFKYYKYYFSYKNEKQMSVLDQAARYGSLETLRWLLLKKTQLNLNLQDRDHPLRTPLPYAVLAGNLEMVTWLFEESGLIDCSDLNAPSLIGANRDFGLVEIAGMTGNIAMLNYLSKKYLPIFSEGPKFKTALHYAVERGHLKAVKWILEDHEGDKEKNNSRVNLTDDLDCTPLFYAVNKAHIQVAKFLIAKGADLSYENEDGLNVFTAIGNERFLASEKYKLMYYYLLNETQKKGLSIETVPQQGLTDWKKQLIKYYMNIFPVFLEHFPKEIAHTVIVYSGISITYFFNDIKIMALLSPPKCRIEVENPTKVDVVPPDDLDEQETNHQSSASLKRPRDEEEQPNKRNQPSFFTTQPFPQQNNIPREEEPSFVCP